ncbi:MAG TPA: phage tail tape measure C-terminal domain-containing protein [Noviherbaspirillum sp.]|nr:phage tail tape measure C-terminal domain-containing protein [Noviherbaspirillum sp.]
MGRAAYQTEQAMQRIQGAADVAKNALAALGIGASVGGFALLIKGAIDAADNLRDMSQKTGIAVETLNGLGFAAGQAGGNLESMVAAAGKLNKSIAEAAGGNQQTSDAFKALGISVLDASGNLKKADVVMAEVADKFAQYQDGPEKAALALRIFGKAGADMIPLLNDGGDAMRENIEYAKQYSGATAELSAAADNFNDTMGKLAIQQKSFANAMAAAVLPILQRVTEEILGASEQSDKFALATSAVRTVLETFVVVGSEVAFTFKAVGTEIGGIAAQLAALAHGDIKGFNAISQAMKEDAKKARQEHDKFIADILNRTPTAAGTTSGTPPPKKSAPTLLDPSAGKDLAALAKAQLDGQLKTMENALAQERDVMQFHDQYVAELRSQDLIDLTTYEDYRKRALDENLAATTRTYDAEIAALEAYKAKATESKDRQDAQNKIDDLTAKKEKARQDAMQKSDMLTLGLAKAQNALNAEMKEWSIQQDAAANQFQFEIDMLGKSAIEVAKLTNARRIQLDVEERIRQAQKNSATPIDRAKFDNEAAAAIAKSNALYDSADAKQKDPWFNMSESIRRYGEEADNVGAQIGNGMTNAFQSAEDAFVQFAMTGKLSFGDLARSIIADLARIQAKKMIVGLIDMAIGAFTGGVGNSGGSVGSAGGPSLGSYGLSGGRAGGGPVDAYSSYLVGEKGPEILRMGSAGGTIIPNDKLGGNGGPVVNLTQNIQIDSRSDAGAIMSAIRQNGERVKTEISDLILRGSRAYTRPA